MRCDEAFDVSGESRSHLLPHLARLPGSPAGSYIISDQTQGPVKRFVLPVGVASADATFRRVFSELGTSRRGYRIRPAITRWAGSPMLECTLPGTTLVLLVVAVGDLWPPHRPHGDSSASRAWIGTLTGEARRQTIGQTPGASGSQADEADSRGCDHDRLECTAACLRCSADHVRSRACVACARNTTLEAIWNWERSRSAWR